MVDPDLGDEDGAVVPAGGVLPQQALGGGLAAASDVIAPGQKLGGDVVLNGGVLHSRFFIKNVLLFVPFFIYCCCCFAASFLLNLVLLLLPQCVVFFSHCIEI